MSSQVLIQLAKGIKFYKTKHFLGFFKQSANLIKNNEQYHLMRCYYGRGEILLPVLLQAYRQCESPFCALGKSLEKRGACAGAIAQRRSHSLPVCGLRRRACECDFWYIRDAAISTLRVERRRKKNTFYLLPLDTCEAWVAVLFRHEQTTAPGSLYKI